MSPIARRLAWGLTLVSLGAMVGCSTPMSRPTPVDIPAVTVGQELTVRTLPIELGAVQFSLGLTARQQRLALADSSGRVLLLDAESLRVLWRAETGAPLQAAAGTDGRDVAVVSRAGRLLVLSDGQIRWQQQLTSDTFTAPLVAGGRVFVLGADRSVSAFDGQTGTRLWQRTRPGEPLVLREAGVLQTHGERVLASHSGRLQALNPDTGVPLWEAVVSVPRGVNDMERLVDLLGPAARMGEQLCVRAFQTQVACLEGTNGQLLWSRAITGERAVAADADRVYVILANGSIQALRRTDGERLWESDRLKYRQLGRIWRLDKTVLVSDSGGWVYALNPASGELQNRLRLTDEPLAGAIVLDPQRSLVVTRSGRVFEIKTP